MENINEGTKEVVLETTEERTIEEKLDKFCDDHAGLLIGLGTGLLVGFGYLLGRFDHKLDKKISKGKIMNEFGKAYGDTIDMEVEKAVNKFARRVCPAENVLYVVERFHDACGVTHGTIEEYISSNFKLVENK